MGEWDALHLDMGDFLAGGEDRFVGKGEDSWMVVSKEIGTVKGTSGKLNLPENEKRLDEGSGKIKGKGLDGMDGVVLTGREEGQDLK